MLTIELDLKPCGRVNPSSDGAIDRLARKPVADVVELIGKARKRRETEETERRREWERQRAIAVEKERVEALRKAAAALRAYRVLTDYIEEVRRFGAFRMISGAKVKRLRNGWRGRRPRRNRSTPWVINESGVAGPLPVQIQEQRAHSD